MTDEEDDYIASLRDQRSVTLRGNRTPPSSDSQSDTFIGYQGQELIRRGGREVEYDYDRYANVAAAAQYYERANDAYSPRTFATSPPEFRPSQHNRGRAATQQNQRDTYWKNNKIVLKETRWGSVTTHIPILPPNTETKTIKATCFRQCVTRIKAATGNWRETRTLHFKNRRFGTSGGNRGRRWHRGCRSGSSS